MKMTLQADPGELAAKGPAFLDRMAKALEEQAPEVAQALRKAAVDVQAGKRAIMRLPAQQEGLEAIQGLYRQTLTAMLGEMGEALDDASRGDGLEKAGGPFIGPRGGKWADAQHTVAWDDAIHGKMRSGVAHVDAKEVAEIADTILAMLPQDKSGMVDTGAIPSGKTHIKTVRMKDAAGVNRNIHVWMDVGGPDMGELAIPSGDDTVTHAVLTVGLPHNDGAFSVVALGQRIRATVSHELAHAGDPRVWADELKRRQGTPRQYDSENASAYYNHPAEVRAHAVEVFRELNTPKSVTAAKGSGRVTRAGSQSALGGPSTRADVSDWATENSKTWQQVEEHLSHENRKKFMHLIANAYTNARAGVAEPVEKSMAAFDEPEGATFQS